MTAETHSTREKIDFDAVKAAEGFLARRAEKYGVSLLDMLEDLPHGRFGRKRCPECGDLAKMTICDWATVDPKHEDGTAGTISEERDIYDCTACGTLFTIVRCFG